jgi:hypothetical protein
MVPLAGWVWPHGTPPAVHAVITGSMMRHASSASSADEQHRLLLSMSRIRWAQAVNRGGIERAPSCRSVREA